MTTIIAVMAGTAVSLALLGLLRPNRSSASAVQRRVEELEEGAHPVDPYTQSFLERVLGPLVRAFSRKLFDLLPHALIRSVDSRLETAGMRMPVNTFMAIWASFAVLIPLLALALLLASGAGFGRMTIFGVLAFVAVCAYLPRYWLVRRGSRRAREIDRKFPDAIDLIVTSVEAGLGLQAAMLMVAEKFEGPIADEFARVIRETSLGRERSEALEAMASRSGSVDLRLFVRAVNQAERMGISIAEVLRSQSKEIRERRRQYAREQAAKIPVKLTIPTIAFIFPTLFLILLGPVILNAIEQLTAG